MTGTKEWYWNFRSKHDHPCIKCGEPCNHRAKMCRDCHNKSHPKGEKSPKWKGGKVKHGDGYNLIHEPKHPRSSNGYVLEHIVVWEETHGKPLPKGWHVHHLNGIKDDNRPQNLEGLPSKKHYLVLQAKAKRIQELEALLNSQSQLL